jgi:uncharacterized protein (TIGR02246 family)
MNMQSKQMLIHTAADEVAIRALPQQMVDGWNGGRIESFAAPFSDNADFIEFEGTQFTGRQAIADFHQQAYESFAKGMQIQVDVQFVHFLGPEVAVMHALARTVLPGQSAPSPSRDSMQLYIVRKHNGEWRIEAFQNARQLSLERQLFLDDFEALPADAQGQVTDLAATLKKRQPAGQGTPAR